MNTPTNTTLRGWVPSLTFAASLLAVTTTTFAADSVLPGWDLLKTQAPTKFSGIPLEGVPLGLWDFGTGPLDTCTADTLIQRKAEATPVSGPIPIEMVALQLKTVNDVDLGAGVGLYYITSQNLRGGPQSDGTMTINFDDNTFSSDLTVFFDVRFGALNGPIIFSDEKTFTLDSATWTHDAPDISCLYDGINYRLNGLDSGSDFWPGFAVHIAPGDTCHSVLPVPEASPLSAVSACGLVVLVWSATRRRLQPNSHRS